MNNIFVEILFNYFMFYTIKKSILFVNKTNLPILVEGWYNISEGLSELKSVCIDSYEEKIIYSATGEWFINTYFYDLEIINKWKENNLKIGESIGKFTTNPSYSGEYSWLNNNLFDILYENDKIIFFLTP